MRLLISSSWKRILEAHRVDSFLKPTTLHVPDTRSGLDLGSNRPLTGATISRAAFMDVVVPLLGPAGPGGGPLVCLLMVWQIAFFQRHFLRGRVCLRACLTSSSSLKRTMVDAAFKKGSKRNEGLLLKAVVVIIALPAVTCRSPCLIIEG